MTSAISSAGAAAISSMRSFFPLLTLQLTMEPHDAVAARPNHIQIPFILPTGKPAIYGLLREVKEVSKVVSLLVVLVVVAAGCGTTTAKPIDASGVRACLTGHQAAVEKATDAIATAALASFDARLGRGDIVTLAFHRTDADAKRAERGYQLMAAAFGLSANDLLSVRGNVSVAWNHSPTSRERGLVDGCLK